MINGLNSIDSSFDSSLLSSMASDPLASVGNSVGFDSIFSQAMSQATTPQQKAQTAFLEVEYNDLNTLYNAVSGDSDPLTGSLNDLMNLDMNSVGSQLSQLESLLGLPNTSGTTSSANSQGLTSDQLMGLASQQLLNNDLASFGTDSGSSINALA